MKKQILFLAIFTLAIFLAGTTKSYGQLLPGVTSPTRTPLQAIPALSCTGNANFLHPMAGISYTYSMDGTTGAEDVSTWRWFATKNPDFITNAVIAGDSLKEGVAGQLLAASANYGTTSATNSVQITWTPQILANTLYQGPASTTVFPSPTFVVGYGQGENCADNIKVYEINPILSFTIDIANINYSNWKTMAWDKDTVQCVDIVRSATYTSSNDALLMDYGTDTLYFEIAAANFINDFQPYFQLISGITAPQTAEITLFNDLANARAHTNARATSALTVGTQWASGVNFTAANASEVATGVSLVAKVVITNTTFESLTAQNFVLAVDARENNNAGKWDMEDEDCTYDPLKDVADQIDRSTHIVNPRPTIVGANVPDTNTAAPNDIVPKLP